MASVALIKQEKLESDVLIKQEKLQQALTAIVNAHTVYNKISAPSLKSCKKTLPLKEPKPPHQHQYNILGQKCDILMKLQKFSDALSICNELLNLFTPWLAENNKHIGKILNDKGVCLRKLGQPCRSQDLILQTL